MDVNSIIANASNIRAGENPSYTTGDFLSLYPQFGDSTVMPTMIIQIYIDLALTCIQKDRWRGAWGIAIGLFVAHFCTMWLKTSATASDKDEIVAAGAAQGITVSESVDGVSYSMDVGAVSNDLQGFAAWKSTQYGLQLATMAKLYGKGGMAVW